MINGSSVRLGKTKSCGCYAKEVRTERMSTHSQSRSKTYNIWVGIKQRCLNPNSNSYENYGARGITISEEWMDFENFYRDMGECPEGLTIERIDNDGDYRYGNCIWADRSTQNINKSYRNLTTNIRNISYCERDDLYYVGISRNGQRYRKSFKELDDAISWKEEILESLR